MRKSKPIKLTSSEKSELITDLARCKKIASNDRSHLYEIAGCAYRAERYCETDADVQSKMNELQEAMSIYKWDLDTLIEMYGFSSDRDRWLKDPVGVRRDAALNRSRKYFDTKDKRDRYKKKDSLDIVSSANELIGINAIPAEDGPAEPPATDSKNRILGANGKSSLAPQCLALKEERLLFTGSESVAKQPESDEEVVRGVWYRLTRAQRLKLFELPEVWAFSDEEPDCGMIPRPNRVRQKPEKAPPPKLAKPRRRKAS